MKTEDWCKRARRMTGVLAALTILLLLFNGLAARPTTPRQVQDRPNNINPAGSYLAPPSFASNYSLAFYQNFAAMTSDAQILVDEGGKDSIGRGAWWVPVGGQAPCIKPMGHDSPFGIDDGSLTMRMQRNHAPGSWWDGWTTGELWSVDKTGAGFTQKYGYFEVSMQVPSGNNTWPAFWLVDGNPPGKAPAYGAEIDIEESSSGPTGDPNTYAITCHAWPAKDGFTNIPHTSVSSGVIKKPQLMTTGLHTYGADLEPNGITFYFDRKPVWFNPHYPAMAQPLAMRLSLAMTNQGKQATSPTDLHVKYVSVWASPNSPNYTGTALAAPAEAVAKAKSSSQISLSWKAVNGVTSYNIYRSAQPGGQGPVPYATVVDSTHYVDTGLAAQQTYYYRVAAVDGSGAGATSAEVRATTRFAKDSLPAGWTGEASYDRASGTFTLTAKGGTSWGEFPPLSFVSQPASGADMMIIAEVAEPTLSFWSNGTFPLLPGWFTQPTGIEAGIMFRDASHSKSDSQEPPYVWLGSSLHRNDDQGILLTCRKDAGQSVALASFDTHYTQVFPYWLKLVKSGSTFDGYYAYATKGGTVPANDRWIKVGSTTVEFANQTYLAGLEVASHSKSGGGSATFTHVAVAANAAPAGAE